MTKIASEILYTTDGQGDIAKLRNEIKLVEACQWYDSKRLLGKKAGDQEEDGVKNVKAQHMIQTCVGAKESAKFAGK